MKILGIDFSKTKKDKTLLVFRVGDVNKTKEVEDIISEKLSKDKFVVVPSYVSVEEVNVPKDIK